MRARARSGQHYNTQSLSAKCFSELGKDISFIKPSSIISGVYFSFLLAIYNSFLDADGIISDYTFFAAVRSVVQHNIGNLVACRKLQNVTQLKILFILICMTRIHIKIICYMRRLPNMHRQTHKYKSHRPT